jgi:predicted transcriptional regulator
MGRKKSNFPLKPIPVKLDAALLARIDALAARMGEGRSTIMRFAMRIGLENLQKAIDSGADLDQLTRQTSYPKHQEQSSLVEEGGKSEKPPKITSVTYTNPTRPRRRRRGKGGDDIVKFSPGEQN